MYSVCVNLLVVSGPVAFVFSADSVTQHLFCSNSGVSGAVSYRKLIDGSFHKDKSMNCKNYSGEMENKLLLSEPAQHHSEIYDNKRLGCSFINGIVMIAQYGYHGNVDN